MPTTTYEAFNFDISGSVGCNRWGVSRYFGGVVLQSKSCSSIPDEISTNERTIERSAIVKSQDEV